ncbi:hypothetical protein FHR87_003358 [Azomonas macrocytogenes]|uniref:Uncharacterized protein n=1 Tax=Azomonas macrocytogenes TaxID=69962 RepID=A0A839T7U7_AZOMA|nr:hypothetical protein [Azomonas macrocytogenes]
MPVSTSEGLAQFTVQSDAVLIGDRGLTHRREVQPVLAQGGDMILRIGVVSLHSLGMDDVRLTAATTKSTAHSDRQTIIAKRCRTIGLGELVE